MSSLDKFNNRPVSCKDPRMQLLLIAVTSRLDAVVLLYKSIASNGKSVMHCILAYAVVKVYWNMFISRSLTRRLRNSTHHGVC